MCQDKFLYVLYPFCLRKAFTPPVEADHTYFCFEKITKCQQQFSQCSSPGRYPLQVHLALSFHPLSFHSEKAQLLTTGQEMLLVVQLEQERDPETTDVTQADTQRHLFTRYILPSNQMKTALYLKSSSSQFSISRGFSVLSAYQIGRQQPEAESIPCLTLSFFLNIQTETSTQKKKT